MYVRAKKEDSTRGGRPMQIESVKTKAGAVNERIPMSEKRLLNIREFQVYASVGRNSAFSLAEEAGAIFHWGRRILVDRVKFDAWCDGQN